jgi:hypothetical protein
VFPQDDSGLVEVDMDPDQMMMMPQGHKQKREKKKKFVRTAAGTVWEDPTLAEWDPGKMKLILIFQFFL